MGAIIFMVICIVCTGIFFFLGNKLFMDYDREFLGMVCIAVAVIFAIAAVISIINFICWLMISINIEANIIANIETREMYVNQLAAYEATRSNDIFASDMYLNLYKEVVSFNKEINKAANGSWWSEGLLWDPSYVGIETIAIGGIK